MMLYVKDGPEEAQCSVCLEWFPTEQLIKEHGSYYCDFCYGDLQEEYVFELDIDKMKL